MDLCVGWASTNNKSEEVMMPCENNEYKAIVQHHHIETIMKVELKVILVI